MGEPIEVEPSLPSSLAAASKASPQNVRHNACFLHDRGMGDGRGWLPVKNMVADCNYKDMVTPTIYMAGTRSCERLYEHHDKRHEREASLKEFSDDRFRRQRNTAR